MAICVHSTCAYGLHFIILCNILRDYWLLGFLQESFRIFGTTLGDNSWNTWKAFSSPTYSFRNFFKKVLSLTNVLTDALKNSSRIMVSAGRILIFWRRKKTGTIFSSKHVQEFFWNFNCDFFRNFSRAFVRNLFLDLLWNYSTSSSGNFPKNFLGNSSRINASNYFQNFSKLSSGEKVLLKNSKKKTFFRNFFCVNSGWTLTKNSGISLKESQETFLTDSREQFQKWPL